MNKLKNNRVIPILVQVLFCALILISPLYMMIRSGDVKLIHYFMYFIRTSLYIFVFYINYLFLIDKFLFEKKLYSYFFSNLVIVILIVCLQNFLMEIIASSYLQEATDALNKPKGPPFYIRFWGDVIFIIFTIGLSVAVKSTTRWYQDSIRMEKIKATQLETDLRALRSQLSPHFLFNTLNNIYSLIAIDTVKAQSSVLRLSNLLRYILYENDSQYVPLKNDLEFTSSYIDLMKLRMSSKVDLQASISDCNSKVSIAPFMFMTLIENAFKHGVNSDDNAYIHIHIHVDFENKVICIVDNSKSNHENIESKSSGIGLPNLKKRLDLLYPNQHDLYIQDTPNQFFVQLTIELLED